MSKFKHFQKYQSWYETAMISVYLLINNGILATSTIMEKSRNSTPLSFDLWQPFVHEYSSAIATIVTLPAIIWFMRLVSINWQQLKRSLFYYFIAASVFSVIHVVGMVALRHLAYWTQSMSYDFGDTLFEFLYEYRKDLWSFVFIIAVIHSYRFIVSRLQGEASVIADGEDSPVSTNIDRLLVKKLGKEFIIKIEDIEWLESSGNYVNLHIAGRIYPTRATLGKFMEQLSSKNFCRIHRSHGVNLDVINSITPLPSGDSEVKLQNGKVLNLSRRFKDEFKLRLQH